MKTVIVVLGSLLFAGCGASDGSPSATASASVAGVDLAPVVTEAPSLPAVDVDVDVEALLAGLGEEGIDELGGIECATEVALIAVAGERYEERTGVDADTLDDLASDLGVDLLLWSFDDGAEQLVPAVGSPCPDFFGVTERQSGARACMVDQRTLETAVEATYAQTGAAPVDQQQLVDDGMLRELADDFVVLDGEVIVVAGSECEQLIEESEVEAAAETAEPVEDPARCDVERRTLEVAVEAFYAQFGQLPASEKALVESKMLRSEFADFDLAGDSSVVVVPGSVCEE